MTRSLSLGQVLECAKTRLPHVDEVTPFASVNFWKRHACVQHRCTASCDQVRLPSPSCLQLPLEHKRWITDDLNVVRQTFGFEIGLMLPSVRRMGVSCTSAPLVKANGTNRRSTFLWFSENFGTCLGPRSQVVFCDTKKGFQDFSRRSTILVR